MIQYPNTRLPRANGRALISGPAVADINLSSMLIPKELAELWEVTEPDSPTENHLVLGEFGVQDPDAYKGGPIYSGSAIDHHDNIWIYGNTDYPKNRFWMFNTTSFQFTFLG